MVHFLQVNGQTGKSHRQGSIIIWMTMNAMSEMADTTMDSSGQKLLRDITIMNSKCMLWQGHVTKQLTDDSSSLDAYQIHTGINYRSMEQCSMPLPILHSCQLWIMSHCSRLGIMKIIMCHHDISGNELLYLPIQQSNT